MSGTSAMSRKSVVLIVDDEAPVRFALREVLVEAGHEVREAASGDEAAALLARTPVELVITDLSMPHGDGLQLLRQLQTRRTEGVDAPPVIMLTARGSERHAVEAMKLGALDYLTKPFDIDELLCAVAKACEKAHLARENRALRAELALARTMVFQSAAMREVAAAVERVAGRDVTVLVTGDSGTGKELVAEAIHNASARRERTFVKFSCAAIPETLAEAALFGHERGAFTGADKARPGYFGLADGGTLLIDEVGELPLSMQALLLRALQSGEIQPVGGAVRRVDVRLIAATNRDLLRLVKAGTFREDLYYRLAVVPIHLPRLDERPDDLPPLIDHFFTKLAARYRIDTLQVAPAVRQALAARSWPGNVRELEHAIERLVVLAKDGVVDEAAARSVGDDDAGKCAREDADAPAQTPTMSLKKSVEAHERALIRAALEACGHNQSEAARRLELSRATLIDKMNKYGLR